VAAAAAAAAAAPLLMEKRMTTKGKSVGAKCRGQSLSFRESFSKGGLNQSIEVFFLPGRDGHIDTAYLSSIFIYYLSK